MIIVIWWQYLQIGSHRFAIIRNYSQTSVRELIANQFANWELRELNDSARNISEQGSRTEIANYFAMFLILFANWFIKVRPPGEHLVFQKHPNISSPWTGADVQEYPAFCTDLFWRRDHLVTERYRTIIDRYPDCVEIQWLRVHEHAYD